LLNLLVIYGYYSKDSLITHQLNHRGKCLIEVKAILLFKAPHHLISLISKNFTHYTILNFKYLLLYKRLIVKRVFLLNLYIILDQ
jgi:hypothetical protein